MSDLSVIDRFVQAFITYIDSGFGLLGPDVGFLTSTLIGIDITLAGLFWALGGDDNVIGRFLRKILYIGAFAFILNSFSTLADIIFRSFAQVGLTAGGGTLSADDLLKPGRLAGTGFEAAWPLLDQASDMVGFTSFFDNFLTIMVLLFAWAIVILAFFILAVQMFVTIIEFKLTSLAGFILVPFSLWNRTSFLAERVLGNVVSSGIKVMMLAVIVGIGSNFFGELTAALKGQDPDIGQAMSLVLASLALFGLGIFTPSIASGLVAGAPQLGAGAALGTMVGAGGIAALAGGAAIGTARSIGGGAVDALRAGTSMGTAASTAYALGRTNSEAPSVSAGLGGMARAAGNALRSQSSSRLRLDEARSAGADAGRRSFAGSDTNMPAAANAAPAWAQTLRSEANARHRRQVAIHSISQGDRGGASAVPDIKEKD
ncbi:P-type conjugative transfer protein TrbL [Sphingomonas sp. C8-2]|nr:P-type conjugative transfer protein TrbL [Sphingomonas sp. C8-2]